MNLKPKKAEKATKSIMIQLFDRNNPDFTFMGDWTGHDMQVVIRTIGKAYRRQQLAVRRRLMAENPSIGAVSSDINQAVTTTTEV